MFDEKTKENLKALREVSQLFDQSVNCLTPQYFFIICLYWWPEKLFKWTKNQISDNMHLWK